MGERGDVVTTITNLIAAMPKVELHVHLEGCVTPEMALHFARKNRWSYPYESIEQALAAMEFSDLSSFIEVARVNNRTLRTVDDYCDVARQYLKRMHDENVVHVEVAVSPQGFMRRGLEIKPCIKALASAFREALDNFGMTGGIIAGCQRDRPPDEALEMLNELRACRDDILAVGLHGADPHAGEEGPADYVAQAIDILAVERIDHGVRAEEDPALLERLAADQVPLTVCPLSNVNLGVFARLEEHNIARLLRRGIPVSLHSDDPPYFGGYLSHCFEQTAAALDLSAAEVVEMNKNAIRAAFLDPETKQRLLAASEAVLSGAASKESDRRV